jgi:hypothetical protein
MVISERRFCNHGAGARNIIEFPNRKASRSPKNEMVSASSYDNSPHACLTRISNQWGGRSIIFPKRGFNKDIKSLGNL